MKNENEFAVFEFEKSDENLVRELSEYLRWEAYKVYEFFET